MALFHYFICLSSIPLYHIFFIQSYVNGCLSCTHVLAVVNSAAMNTGVHVSFQVRVFVLSGYMPRAGIARSSVQFSSVQLLRRVLLFATP